MVDGLDEIAKFESSKEDFKAELRQGMEPEPNMIGWTNFLKP